MTSNPPQARLYNVDTRNLLVSRTSLAWLKDAPFTLNQFASACWSLSFRGYARSRGDTRSGMSADLAQFRGLGTSLSPDLATYNSTVATRAASGLGNPG